MPCCVISLLLANIISPHAILSRTAIPSQLQVLILLAL